MPEPVVAITPALAFTRAFPFSGDEAFELSRCQLDICVRGERPAERCSGTRWKYRLDVKCVCLANMF